MPALRLSVVDGLFYPGASAALRAQIVDFLAAAGADDATRLPPKLLITPHAGYGYCGAVAASAYSLLTGERARSISRIVLLGPAHRVVVQGLAAHRASAFETPLGEVALDLKTAKTLGITIPYVILLRADRVIE